MKLNLISFVGVDTQTKREDIQTFKGLSDIATEFSILYSESKSTARYPDLQFCKDYLAWGLQWGIPASLHLCGQVIDKYLKRDPDIMDLCRPAWRIQLNLNIKNYPDYDKLSDEILEVIEAQKHNVILQQNKTKEKFMECFLKKASHPAPVALLHDSSGGFGREITKVSPPHKNYYTGYAGGINPDNVSKIVNLIENVNVEQQSYYIDMESGVRTDNVFSIEKCRQVVNNLR